MIAGCAGERERPMYEYGSSKRPDWKLAVVVGAGGMGMAVARRLAQRHRVLLADIDGGRAEAEAAAMRDGGCDATAIACDITSPGSVAKLAGEVKERGGLGVLAHVAGLSPTGCDFHSILRVNLMGAALTAEALLPLAGQSSCAILIASMAAYGIQPNEDELAVLREPAAPDLAERLADVIGEESVNAGAGYTYAKYGLLLYARRNAAAWGERGARIVSLSPGLIATPMGAKEFAANEHKRRMFEASPLKREGTMLEIADAVEFLASDRASFISGTDLLVDGGLTAALQA
jgi:NAD(P)-dependent dehydrogenase (short-subunit alcohol dehydrogenase family)